MTSRIEIENWALIYLEEDTQTNIDNSSSGQTIDLLYNSVYRQLLKKNTYGWTFARKIATLNQIANPPSMSNQYANAYQLPLDYLMMITPLQSFNTFRIVGKFLYTSDDSFQMLYVSTVDESLLSDEFSHAFAYDLAARVAGKITGKQGIKQYLDYKFAMALRNAVQLDIAQMDTQQYMPPVNAIYQSHFDGSFTMGSLAGLSSIGKQNGS
tara:strand:+ start:2580 stop:3212 length:633 start_codon:yes stop_codon:yes gene_type:complete